MLKNVKDTGRELSEDDVRGLETRLGFHLPTAYRTFLKMYNGGTPQPNVFPISGFRNNPQGDIQIFFGIDREIECIDIFGIVGTMSGRIPKNLSPIATDGSGNLICLSLFGDDEGCVYFWNYYEEQPGPDPGYDNVYKIADSFEEFLESLHAYKEGGWPTAE